MMRFSRRFLEAFCEMCERELGLRNLIIIYVRREDWTIELRCAVDRIMIALLQLATVPECTAAQQLMEICEN